MKKLTLTMMAGLLLTGTAFAGDSPLIDTGAVVPFGPSVAKSNKPVSTMPSTVKTAIKVGWGLGLSESQIHALTELTADQLKVYMESTLAVMKEQLAAGQTETTADAPVFYYDNQSLMPAEGGRVTSTPDKLLSQDFYQGDSGKEKVDYTISYDTTFNMDGIKQVTSTSYQGQDPAVDNTMIYSSDDLVMVETTVNGVKASKILPEGTKISLVTPERVTRVSESASTTGG